MTADTIPAAEDSGDMYNTIDQAAPEYIAALESEAKSVMLLGKDVYANANKSGGNIILSDDAIEQLVDAIGDAGYSVIDHEGKLNMRNPGQITEFGNLVNAGQDAEAVYYVVHSDGSLHMNALSYTNGTGKLITISLEWNPSLEPAVYDEGRYELQSIVYTEKGWLILDRDIANFNINKKFNVDSHTLVRVKPYDETCRQLCEKYIAPVGYSENNLFTLSWQETDYGDLDFNCLFPILYGMYYNAQELNFYNSNASFDRIEGTQLHLIPTPQFEEVITAYFNIAPEQLRGLADYNAELGGYYMCGYQTGYYNVVPRIPEPEVTDYRFNSDGTLTLTIDAVFSWYGTDRAFTHEVTMRDTERGFEYVSNYVQESADNIFPELTLHSERLKQISRARVSGDN